MEFVNQQLDNYFDQVQDEVKKILIDEYKMKEEDVERYNSKLIKQDDRRSQFWIKKYVDECVIDSISPVDCAKNIIKKFKPKTDNNMYVNQINNLNKSNQDAPNVLMKENVLDFKEFKQLKKCQKQQ
jgi:hypothetical protein